MHAVAYNPYHNPRRRPRREANPVGLGSAIGIGVGLIGVGLGAWGLKRYLSSGLVPTSVPHSSTKKVFLQVAVSPDGSSVALSGPADPLVSINGSAARIVSPEPVDLTISLPAGLGANAYQSESNTVNLVASTQQDFVFRWLGGPTQSGQAALQILAPAPAAGMGPVPIGDIVVDFSGK